ncbi:hypothetical protein [Gordonia iterans]
MTGDVAGVPPERPPVALAGLAGAQPGVLVAGLAAEGVHGTVVVGEAQTPPPTARAAVLAVDLTIDAGSAEEELLAALRATGAPVALVGAGAGADADWPGRLAAARRRLDPARRLPVFAVSTDLLRAGDPTRSGLPALARWCADPGPAAGPDPSAAPARDRVRRDGRAADPAREGAARLAGARAGLADLRGRLAVDLRAGAAQLTRRIQSARGPVATEWLTDALTMYAGRVEQELTAGLDHIRAALLVGLPASDPGVRVPGGAARGRTPGGPPFAARIRPPEVTARSAQLAAEDLVLLVLGASAGFGVGRMLVGPLVQWAGLGAAATALTVLAGLAVAAGVVLVRRQASRAAAARAAAVEAVGGLRGTLEHAVAARLGAAEAQLARELWNRTGRSCVQPSREKE